jgi:hypothetical protein
MQELWIWDYNTRMQRPLVFTLLFASVLCSGTVQAQRSGGAFPGAAGRGGISAGFRGHGTRGGFFRGHPGFRSFQNFNTPFFPFWYDLPIGWYDEPFGWDEAPYPETMTTEPMAPVVVVQRDAPRAAKPEVLAPNPLVIEVPGKTKAAPSKPLPPTIFIFTNGEHLEGRQYMLTQDRLYLTVDRQHRVIPLTALDINATVAANRARGIELQVPAERDEIFLGF